MDYTELLPPLPEADLHAHELIRNGGGVWLGCKSLDVVQQAHDPDETGEEIKTLFTAEQVRAAQLAAIAAAAPAIRKAERERCARVCEQHGSGGFSYAAAIRALPDEAHNARLIAPDTAQR